MLLKRYLGLGHNCKQPVNEKPIGYEKAIILFIFLTSGIILSLVIVLFEYIARYMKKKPESAIEEQKNETLLKKLLQYNKGRIMCK